MAAVDLPMLLKWDFRGEGRNGGAGKGRNAGGEGMGGAFAFCLFPKRILSAGILLCNQQTPHLIEGYEAVAF